MESVSFNGVVLTNAYTVLGIRKPHSRQVETIGVQGRDGVIVRNASLVGPQVSLRFVVDGTRAELEEARRAIGAALSVREPRRLQFGNDGGLYYMAMPNGEPDWAQFSRSGRMDVPFLVPSPAMYGAEHVATVPSGESVSFEVGGTYPTAPTITASSASNGSSSGVWGVRLDNADFVHVAIPTGYSSRSVAVDCEARTCRVGGTLSLPTIDSDWFELSPGSHVVRMDNGTGAAVLRWQERWLA